MLIFLSIFLLFEFVNAITWSPWWGPSGGSYEELADSGEYIKKICIRSGNHIQGITVTFDGGNEESAGSGSGTDECFDRGTDNKCFNGAIGGWNNNDKMGNLRFVRSDGLLSIFYGGFTSCDNTRHHNSYSAPGRCITRIQVYATGSVIKQIRFGFEYIFGVGYINGIPEEKLFDDEHFDEPNEPNLNQPIYKPYNEEPFVLSFKSISSFTVFTVCIIGVILVMFLSFNICFMCYNMRKNSEYSKWVNSEYEDDQ